MPLVEVVAHNVGKNAQPGWAYVPDTGFDPSKQPIQPTNKKRNARTAGVGGDHASSHLAKAVSSRLADLDRDNWKDAHIQVPTRGTGRAKGKTAATRKILVAQKNFNNYIADEEALTALETSNQTTRQREPVQMLGLNTPQFVLPPRNPRPNSLHFYDPKFDDERLKHVVVPKKPSEELLNALTSAPPLSYNAAKAKPPAKELPPRKFCEICGYWGNIKCTACGSRVCGLQCLTSHQDGRCLKYGG